MKKNIKQIITFFKHYKNLKVFIKKKFVVFLYHRVLPNKIEDLSNNYVLIKDFENQLRYIKKNFDIINFNSFANIKNDNNQIRAIISFDDGYKDNYKYALPILENLQIPAIFFIPTYYIDNEKIIWDRYLSLLINFANRHSKEFHITNLNDQVIFQKKNNDLVSQSNFWYLINYFKYQKIDKIEKDLQNLKEQIKFIYSYNENDFCLSSTDINSISANNFFSIGSHSHYHLSFKNYNNEHIINELSNSKKIIENIIKKKCISFAYPFGSYKDFNNNQFKIIKNIGFNNIFLNINGINNINQYRLSYKRIIMHSNKNLKYILG